MKQAPSIELPIQTTLEDLYIGKSFEILHRKQDLCSKCRGNLFMKKKNLLYFEKS